MFKKGDKVTIEPKTYFDGTLNPKWPTPHYIGTVIRLTNIRGVDYAKVSYGPNCERVELENLNKLIKIEDQ